MEDPEEAKKDWSKATWEEWRERERKAKERLIAFRKAAPIDKMHLKYGREERSTCRECLYLVEGRCLIFAREIGSKKEVTWLGRWTACQRVNDKKERV